MRFEDYGKMLEEEFRQALRNANEATLRSHFHSYFETNDGMEFAPAVERFLLEFLTARETERKRLGKERLEADLLPAFFAQLFWQALQRMKGSEKLRRTMATKEYMERLVKMDRLLAECVSVAYFDRLVIACLGELQTNR